jgi:metallo-beta-lactamase family protein
MVVEFMLNSDINLSWNNILTSQLVQAAVIIQFDGGPNNYLLWQLRRTRIPNVPYIIDTPMGISAMKIFSFV